MPERTTTAVPVKKRVDYLDSIRGLCILFVNYSHANVSLFMLKFVSCACVQPYIFMAGYFYRETTDFGDSFRKKFRTMMVPYFVLSLTYYLIWLVFSFGEGADPVNPLHAILLMPLEGFPIEPSLYFLPVMFGGIMLFTAVVTYVRKEAARALVIIAITLAGNLWNDRLHMRLPMAFDCAMSLQLYFYLGFHGKKIMAYLDTLWEKLPRRWMRFGVFIFFALMNQILIDKNYIQNLLNSSWRIIPLTHFNTCMLMVLLVYFFRYTEKLHWMNGVNRVLKYIGKNAIFFMIFSHVALKISFFICTRLPVGDGFLFKALYCILTLFIEVPIIELINRTKLRFVFGK